MVHKQTDAAEIYTKYTSKNQLSEKKILRVTSPPTTINKEIKRERQIDRETQKTEKQKDRESERQKDR